MRAVAGMPIRGGDRLLLLLCLSPLLGVGCAPTGPPTADAGSDQVVDAGASVTLDGSASSGALSFSWRQLLGTSVLLSSASAPTVTFTAPANGTNLVFELTVSNGQSESTARVNVSVRLVDASAEVEERRQRSVTEDPAAMGDFPDDWLIANAGAGLPGPPAPGQDPDDEPEFQEFVERFEGLKIPDVVQEELLPGATRTITLDIDAPSGLAGLAQWISTTGPLEVTIALDGTTLATGSTYSMGDDRGGSYVSAQTTAGGQASFSVTNTTDVTHIVRMSFAARNIERE